MKIEENYFEINKNSWNAKTEFHIKSDFYDMINFRKGKTSLNDIELNILGDIKGKKVLHLQCHFGQDSISLQKLGANVTGVDLSDKAINYAIEISKELNSDTEFICCDIYDLPQHLNQQFDIIFTSYGVVGWLPDLNKWAQIISQFLKPKGKLVFVEFHPVVWMFDDEFDKIGYNYFNDGAIKESLEGTYADRNAPITQEYVMWNHSVSEVLNSLINNGLEINLLNEYDYSPYNCFKHTIEFEPKKFRIKHIGNKIPMVYAIQATKNKL